MQEHQVTTIRTSSGQTIITDGAGSGRGPAVAGAPEAPALPPIPRGGGRFIINGDGEQKVVTYSSLPPDVYRLARGAEHTALGLMGILAAIIILGPFARLFARRLERRAEMQPSQDALLLQQQLQHLQESVDTMCVEVERISEAQRFQSKLLFESQRAEPGKVHLS